MGTSSHSAVVMSHLFLRDNIRPGDRVVDATCGNGNDTLLLAMLVGPEGTVFAFDVQEQALANTKLLLEKNGCLERVRLFHAGHEELAKYVKMQVQEVVFNLGYLPGSDKSCMTRPETTLAALEQAAGITLMGGVIIAVVYPGHKGGDEEAAAVEGWFAALSPKNFCVWCSRQINHMPTAPYVIVAWKVF